MKTIKREFLNGSRYMFDFGECRAKNGWAQIDTSQDASYYGNWTNPFKLTVISYAEGDIAIITCDTIEEYIQEIRDIESWNLKYDPDFKFGIDGMCNEQLINRFNDLGLSDLLH